ncbi:MAG: energy transducer TonB, partial [Pseudomonas sp.]|nr:energy transducer TonB [Pseudomonas sp.]
MTLPADIPSDLLPPRVRPVDRLGFTLFLAALVHLALILGVGFTVVKPAEIRHTMDITLATFKSEKAPEKADFQAQENQQGSGTLDKKAVPTTTELAPFQDSKINKITPPPAARPEVVPPPPPQKSAVVT